MDELAPHPSFPRVDKIAWWYSNGERNFKIGPVIFEPIRCKHFAYNSSFFIIILTSCDGVHTYTYDTPDPKQPIHSSLERHPDYTLEDTHILARSPQNMP